MNKKLISLSDEVKKNIKNRIILCVFILIIAHIISISFYLNYFIEQNKRQLNDITKDLTPYIISQEIIGNRYAIDLKIDQIEKSYNIHIKWIKQKPSHGTRINVTNPFTWKYLSPLTSIDNKYYGYYEIQFSILNDPWITFGLIIQLVFLLIFLMIIYYILYPISNKIPKKIFLDPIKNLIHLIDTNNQNLTNTLSAPAEIVLLKDRFIEIISKNNEILKKNEIIKIAEQVAHDIRSPLAAINTALSDVASIPENKRILIKSAAKRINDIANNLLFKHKNNYTASENIADEALSSELIFVTLDNIISEKRLEYQDSKIDIQFNIAPDSFNCFSDIHLSSFKRLFSNLINNSIESIKTNGMITVYLKSAKDGLEIIIEDNGCGIPPDLLSRIFEQGFSFNKKNGAGFGLSYSKQCIEQLGGRLVVQSELNIGTKITITLNRSVTPDWFCDAIFINDRTQTVILDDDPSIHHAWIERFSKVTDNKLIHFYKASDFIEKYHDIKYKTGLYLIDYELLNDNMNGLDVIQKLSISDKSFLVTSCFEDKDIRERSIQHGNKIIPKSYVPYIPIQYAPIQSQNFINKNQIIFIDNDELMRATWIFAAKAAGISISTYTSFNEFKKVSNQYEKNILIYIDSDLGDEAKGEVYAKQLFEQGFTEIHLCTGHHPQQFSNMPWIKSITGKEFPFIHHKELL